MNRARDWWDRLGRNNQIIVVASSVGLLVALIGFIVWAGTPEYVPLFSNLSAQDANAITEKLRDGGVPFRLTQGGTAIEVPAQMHDEWQMKLVSQNLPSQSSGGTLDSGDDILKSASPMDTQPMEDLRMRRALEERVAHTIATMDPVASATVHYAPPENNPLVLGNHDASASVFLTLKPGHQLSDENVRAIVRLAQMSTTGLSDKNISVVDSMGNLLWDGLHTGGVQDDALHKQEREMAMQQRTDLQMALDRTIGPHKSIVLAQVELDGDETKTHESIPEPGAVKQKMDDNEELKGQGNANRPAVGAAGNVNGAPANGAGTTTYPSVTTNNPNSDYKHETTATYYDTGTKVIDKQAVPGEIKKLSVSVLLDSSKIPATDLTTTEATIKQVVETAIGYDPTDATHSRLVSVSAVAFDHQEEQAAAKAEAEAATADNMRHMAAILVPFLIMMVALLILARALRKPRQLASGQRLALPGGGELAPGIGSLMLGSDSSPLGGHGLDTEDESPIALSTGNNSPRTFEVIKEAFDANLESILHLSRSKPEMVAMLLKSWISDEG